MMTQLSIDIATSCLRLCRSNIHIYNRGLDAVYDVQRSTISQADVQSILSACVASGQWRIGEAVPYRLLEVMQTCVFSDAITNPVHHVLIAVWLLAIGYTPFSQQSPPGWRYECYDCSRTDLIAVATKAAMLDIDLCIAAISDLFELRRLETDLLPPSSHSTAGYHLSLSCLLQTALSFHLNGVAREVADIQQKLDDGQIGPLEYLDELSPFSQLIMSDSFPVTLHNSFLSVAQFIRTLKRRPDRRAPLDRRDLS